VGRRDDWARLPVTLRKFLRRPLPRCSRSALKHIAYGEAAYWSLHLSLAAVKRRTARDRLSAIKRTFRCQSPPYRDQSCRCRFVRRFMVQRRLGKRISTLPTTRCLGRSAQRGRAAEETYAGITVVPGPRSSSSLALPSVLEYKAKFPYSELVKISARSLIVQGLMVVIESLDLRHLSW
jgi:hypothetical protein